MRFKFLLLLLLLRKREKNTITVKMNLTTMRLIKIIGPQKKNTIIKNIHKKLI